LLVAVVLSLIVNSVLSWVKHAGGLPVSDDTAMGVRQQNSSKPHFFGAKIRSALKPKFDLYQMPAKLAFDWPLDDFFFALKYRAINRLDQLTWTDFAEFTAFARRATGRMLLGEFGKIAT
jgi:hypothetical protein